MVEKITFGAGCFWGVEETFKHEPGIIETTVGYMGGNMKNPTYKDVCSGKTGHAEVVQILYDPTIISFADLLDIFWKIHNPTQSNGQGVDIGYQYRSVIYYSTNEQKQIAEKSLKLLEKSGNYDKKIVTEIMPASTFYPAEDYHQDYFEKHKF
jgi:peptide-methionine (S)-S-oxide reductase